MDKKRIKILSAGILPVEPFVYGPILTPYFENVQLIFQLLAANVKVVEVLDDGTEVELDVTNFDKEVKSEHKSSKKSEKKVEEKVEKESPVVKEPEMEAAPQVDEPVPAEEFIPEPEVNEEPVEEATEESEEDETPEAPKKGRRKKSSK